MNQADEYDMEVELEAITGDVVVKSSDSNLEGGHLESYQSGVRTVGLATGMRSRVSRRRFHE